MVFSAAEVRAKSRGKSKKSYYKDVEDICNNLTIGALLKEVKLPPSQRMKTIN